MPDLDGASCPAVARIPPLSETCYFKSAGLTDPTEVGESAGNRRPLLRQHVVWPPHNKVSRIGFLDGGDSQN